MALGKIEGSIHSPKGISDDKNVLQNKYGKKPSKQIVSQQKITLKFDWLYLTKGLFKE